MDLLFYWEQYNSNRPHEITETTFHSLCLLYPVIYVLTADGNLDFVERHFLKQVEKREPHSTDSLHLEVLHVAQYRDTYYSLFVDALRQMIEQGEVQSSTIFHSMHLAARCSYDDWKSNAIYAQYPTWAEIPIKLIAAFLQASETKDSLSEVEKNAILNLMESLTGDASYYAETLETNR